MVAEYRNFVFKIHFKKLHFIANYLKLFILKKYFDMKIQKFYISENR